MSPPVTVLLIEDEPDISRIATLVLTSAGHQVEHHSGWDDRIDPARYDVAVIDIMLPDLDGVQIRDRLHTIDPDLPCIAFTAIPRTVASSGWVDIIGKPFPPGRLVDAVEGAARGRP